jgi:hypothetical protein
MRRCAGKEREDISMFSKGMMVAVRLHESGRQKSQLSEMPADGTQPGPAPPKLPVPRIRARDERMSAGASFVLRSAR